MNLNSDSKDAAAGMARSRELLKSVGLGDRMDHYPVQLSGGEQQRVALARAFVLRPPIVLADEPTGNLDTTNGAAVLELLLHLNRSEGTTLVLVTHDPVLATYANRRIVLRDGLVCFGRVECSICWPHARIDCRCRRNQHRGELMAGLSYTSAARIAARRDAVFARQIFLCHTFNRNRK